MRGNSDNFFELLFQLSEMLEFTDKQDVLSSVRNKNEMAVINNLKLFFRKIIVGLEHTNDQQSAFFEVSRIIQDSCYVFDLMYYEALCDVPQLLQGWSDKHAQGRILFISQPISEINKKIVWKAYFIKNTKKDLEEITIDEFSVFGAELVKINNANVVSYDRGRLQGLIGKNTLFEASKFEKELRATNEIRLKLKSFSKFFKALNSVLEGMLLHGTGLSRPTLVNKIGRHLNLEHMMSTRIDSLITSCLQKLYYFVMRMQEFLKQQDALAVRDQISLEKVPGGFQEAVAGVLETRVTQLCKAQLKARESSCNSFEVPYTDQTVVFAGDYKFERSIATNLIANLDQLETSPKSGDSNEEYHWDTVALSPPTKDVLLKNGIGEEYIEVKREVNEDRDQIETISSVGKRQASSASNIKSNKPSHIGTPLQQNQSTLSSVVQQRIQPASHIMSNQNQQRKKTRSPSQKNKNSFEKFWNKLPLEKRVLIKELIFIGCVLLILGLMFPPSLGITIPGISVISVTKIVLLVLGVGCSAAAPIVMAHQTCVLKKEKYKQVRTPSRPSKNNSCQLTREDLLEDQNFIKSQNRIWKKIEPQRTQITEPQQTQIIVKKKWKKQKYRGLPLPRNRASGFTSSYLPRASSSSDTVSQLSTSSLIQVPLQTTSNIVLSKRVRVRHCNSLNRPPSKLNAARHSSPHRPSKLNAACYSSSRRPFSMLFKKKKQKSKLIQEEKVLEKVLNEESRSDYCIS